MGRLPKKKSTAKKKKKQNRGSVASEAAASGAAVATAPNVATTGKDIKKKRPAAPQRKSGAPSKSAPGEPNFLKKSIQFLREVRVELKKGNLAVQKADDRIHRRGDHSGNDHQRLFRPGGYGALQSGPCGASVMRRPKQWR